MLPHAGDSLSGNFSSIANHLKMIWIENNRSVPKNWKCHQIKHIIRDLNVIRDLNRREQSYLPWLTSVLCILSCTSIRAPTSSGVVGGGRFPTKTVTMVIIRFCQRGLMIDCLRVWSAEREREKERGGTQMSKGSALISRLEIWKFTFHLKIIS